MVYFRDPAILALDYLALQKLCHTLDGLYIWEFVITLYYEWRVIQGRQPYGWTIWIYSLTRLATLMAVISNIVTLNITTETNCQAWVTISFTSAYMTLASSSLLIILRIIAIWNRNKTVVALVIVVWVTNISFLIHGAIQMRSAWVPAQGACSIPDAEGNKAAVISMFITDFFLLLVMLIGLLRMRHRGAGTFALGQLLWKQGVIWFLLATSAELMPVVFVCLNLNNAFNMMFLMPALITLSIAATRMYRSLVDFCSNDVAMDSKPPPRIGYAVSKQMEVAVHATRDEYPISLTGQNVIYIDNNGPGLPGMRFDDDVESGVQK